MMVSFAPEVPVGGGEPGTVRVLNLSSTESIELICSRSLWQLLTK